MLCVTVRGIQRACGAVTGGLSDIGVFDPYDLDFTQAAAIAGVNQVYTAVAERDGVTTPSIHIIQFLVDNGEFTFKHSVTGCSVKYELEWILQIPEIAMDLVTFLEGLDAAGCCCGLGLIYRLNSGKIFVAGERYVNGASITKFIIKHDGSDGTSGKLLDDFSGGNIHLKGSYNRLPYEFSGTWETIEALSDVAGSGS